MRVAAGERSAELIAAMRARTGARRPRERAAGWMDPDVTEAIEHLTLENARPALVPQARRVIASEECVRRLLDNCPHSVVFAQVRWIRCAGG